MPRSKIDSWLMQQNGKPADPENPLPLTATAQAVFTNVPREGGGMMVAYNTLSGAIRELELAQTDYESPRVKLESNGKLATYVPEGYSILVSHRIGFGANEYCIRSWMRSNHEPRLFTVEEW